MKFSFLLILLFISCSHKKSNQRSDGHEELYSEPKITQSEELNKFEKRIIIASTNDLNGHFSPLKIHYTNKNNNEDSILVGGYKALNEYLRILRETHKHTVLVDSGNFSSSESNLNEIKSFYEKNNYDAMTLGINDFKINHKSTSDLKKFSARSNTPLILSNLYDLKTARNVEWKGTKSHLLKEIYGIKVGIIGLVPNDSVDYIPTHVRMGLYIEDMLQSTLKHARLLRSLGADIIIVLTNQSIDCNSKIAETEGLPITKVNFDPNQKDICMLENSFGEYLNRLPPKLVDIVIGGRNDSKMANHINGIMVMSGYVNSKSFNYAEIVYNTETKQLNRKKSVIHQPVFLCHHFFEDTNDCYTDDKSVRFQEKRPAYFLGKKIIIEDDK